MTALAFRLLALFCLTLLPATALADTPKRVALVVGNSAYETTTTLPNTVNDATAVAASLERLGFTVFRAFDASQDALIDTLGEFSRALEGADSAVFFYAGHGMQIDGENYLLPVDIKLDNEVVFRNRALSLNDVLRDVESRARVAIVILDACRDNPFAAQLIESEPSRSASIGRGLAPMKPAGNGAIIAYAAASGQVASDGSGDHSPYTAALLAEMEQPGVEVGLMFRRVAGKVIDETGGIQRPEILVRLADEYYLRDVAPADAATVEVAQATPPPLPDVPVDVTPATPAVAAPAAEEARQAVDTGTRAALWDYAATLVDSPLDPPAAPWTVGSEVMLDEAEPNNSFGTAQLVNGHATINLSMAPQRDRDWFRFSVGQAGRLRVQAPATPAEVTLSVRLLNASGDEVVYWVPAPRPGGELLVDLDLPRPGAYWLEFADGADSGTSPEAFPVSLLFTPQPDLYEPNDRFDQAKHIPLESAFPINTLPRGDHDFFKFTAPSAGSFVIALTSVPDTLAPSFRLLDANYAELHYWIPAPRPGGDNIAVLDVARPGVYTLEIADADGATADIAPMNLATRFVPSPDRFEPNDSMGAAYPVPSTATQTMAIFPARDSDWLELDIQQPGELNIEVASPPANLLLTYRVVDGNGSEIQYWVVAPRAGGDLYGSVDLWRPGRYFVHVTDNNSGSSIEPFDLKLSFTASLDAYEPNDTFGAARPLTPGGEVAFTILPRNDADWFRISVDQPGELAVAIDEGPENLDITYRVVNPDYTELAYWVSAYRPGGLTEGSADLPRPGTYYLEIRDGNNDGRSIEPATLKTVFTPTVGSNEPNDMFGEATPVEITGETVAHVLPIRDGDYHVFYADGPGELDVTIEGVPEALDISFRILNAEEQEIQYWINAPRPGGVTTGTVAIPAAGWYWMEIRDGNNDARSPQPFTVKRVFRKAG
jgi:hypothetical protein